MSEVVKNIRHQIDRFLGTNAVKRNFIAADVRHKLVSQKDNLAFQNRLIDMAFLQRENTLASQA